LFTRKTLIVIGAGASFELDLPLGDGLKKSIAGLLNITFPDSWTQTTGDHQIADILRAKAQTEGKRDWNYLLYKCWLIRDALPGSLSIDNLLDAHRSDPDIAFIGKLAIAKAILSAERSSKLFVDHRKDRELSFADVAGTWLIPLFQLMSEGVSKEEAASIFDKMTFVVFNYDRCLERFLPLALRLYYGFAENEALEIAKRAKIIHPYGRVGKETAEQAFDGLAFGSERYDLKAIAEGINTFSEGVRDKGHAEVLSSAIEEAEQVIFLGFAFHPLNMELLKAPDKTITSISKVFGTTFDLSEAAIRSVDALIHYSFNKLKKPTKGNTGLVYFDEVNLESKAASVFLREHFRGLV
jgi:hypothetical protein